MPARGQKMTAKQRAERSASSRAYWEKMTKAVEVLTRQEGMAKLTRGACSRFWSRLERWEIDEDLLLAGDATQVELLRERLRECEPKLLQPDLPGRVKLMMWAIRECGSAELARDALERAAVALGDSTTPPTAETKG